MIAKWSQFFTLPLSTHFAMLPYSSSHKGLESIARPFSVDRPCDLAWSIDYDRNDSVPAQSLNLWGLGSLSFFLGNLPGPPMNKLGLDSWKLRDHIKQRQIDKLSQLSQPRPKTCERAYPMSTKLTHNYPTSWPHMHEWIQPGIEPPTWSTDYRQ